MSQDGANRANVWSNRGGMWLFFFAQGHFSPASKHTENHKIPPLLLHTSGSKWNQDGQRGKEINRQKGKETKRQRDMLVLRSAYIPNLIFINTGGFNLVGGEGFHLEGRTNIINHMRRYELNTCASREEEYVCNCCKVIFFVPIQLSKDKADGCRSVTCCASLLSARIQLHVIKSETWKFLPGRVLSLLQENLMVLNWSKRSSVILRDEPLRHPSM